MEAPVESELCTAHVADLSRTGEAEALVSVRPDVVFHLAAVVSAEAEADFDKGMRVNVDGTRALFDAVRLSPGAPRVVYASSIAVFGAPFPDPPIPDDFHPTPLTSYGTQKLIGEAMLTDYSRRGFLDGVGIRPADGQRAPPALPTPPRRASSRASSASRSTAWRRGCRSPGRYATPMPSPRARGRILRPRRRARHITAGAAGAT